MAEVTIQAISKRANVSIATVSRVLNQKTNVSDATYARVMQAAEALGYRGPASKGSSRTAPHNLIAVMVPRLQNPFYATVIDGIQDVASRNGYGTVIVQSLPDNGKNGGTPSILAQKGVVNGLITLDYFVHIKNSLAAIDPELPVVQCCEYDEDLAFPYVSIDNYAAARNVINYFNSIGRSRIALFNSTCESLYGKMREAGFRDTLRDFGLNLNEKWIYHLNVIDFNVAYATALELFNSGDCPDAVFAISDVYAAAIIRAARHAGLDVPRDVSVIGFDNTEISLICEPPITTVNQPRFEIGHSACMTLLRMIEGQPQLYQKILLDSELIIRGSA